MTSTFARIPLFLALLHLTTAEQPSAPSPIAAPLRELPWGQLNFLHTTDTHGWHGGHLQEAQYGADWGDYISFAHHLRTRADDDGSDLLLIDTGDRIEGNGLYDASNPKGKYTFDIFRHQQIDVITVGNHELYQQNSSENEYKYTVPNYKHSYIASNLDIHNPKTGDLEPLAARYRKFKTKNQGVGILAFGFLFNFHGNANNTAVQPVQETVKEKWFQDALREKDVDLFLVAGHVPVRDSEEYDLIYRAIRQVKWDTPIVFFGGHTHIRDYRKWEKKAQGIESGRYMETLGFLSMSGVRAGSKSEDIDATAAVKYERRYIDNNLFSLYHHSGKNESNFQTDIGKNVTRAIHDARKHLDLDHAFGCAPKDLWLSRVPYPSADSMLSWIEKEVLPDTFGNATKEPSIIITNSGALRFDIFKGPFTIDTTFLVSPFTSGFRMIRGVPYGAASQVLQLLNNEGPIPLKDLAALDTSTSGRIHDLLPPYIPASQMSRTNAPTHHGSHVQSIDSGAQVPLQPSVDPYKDPQLPGYTTSDDLGTDGDDTIHQAIQFYDSPNCMASTVNFDPVDKERAPETVDLVYNQFIQDWVILALRYLGASYEKKDTVSALDDKSMTDVVSDWVGDNWACEG
ncbi:hypothetical protein K431DRAFT_310072 [Polychaeton citri CBS 116435]|uniref:Calcineurin-like phosphoesterase domain-containing protein n=1 Tax=Polychaeton citri CBS 116435 TaxID=1314669 RepID=A0A9P4UTA1_9PEZI|nr:hypothetical protein K431DRAFT_310072 [Polychaeton citri CBS 116435]